MLDQLVTRIRIVPVVAVFALAMLVPTSTSLAAAPAQQQTARFPECRTSELTDVVDRTTKVSGGGSISCDKFLTPGQMMLVVFVELHRNGKKVAAATENNQGQYGASSAVDFTDRTPGKQRWQVKVTYGGVWHAVKWGNVLYH